MSLRLKKMAAFAKGKTLDVGFANLPNPYLRGYVVGVDLESVPCPENYSGVVVGDMTRVCFAGGDSRMARTICSGDCEAMCLPQL